MSLRARVFGAMAVLLALTVLGAWALAGGAVLGPLLGAVAEERADVAAYVATEILAVEGHEERELRAGELSRELGVRMRLVRDTPPFLDHARVRTVERDGRTITFFRHGPERRPGTLVSLAPAGQGPPYLALHFRADTDSPQRNVGLGLLLLGLAAVMAAVGTSRWMLRPLETAGAAMERVAGGDLSHRVDLGSGPDAVAGIGRTFNHMADRVEGMVEGQRELMAAVSHELRTPLARLGLQAELLREGGAPEARITAVEADIAEIDALVGELLESARLHQGLLALHRDELRLSDVVAEALAATDLGARPVEVDVPEDLVLLADRDRLLRVLRNLLSNIRRYTPDDAPVELRATRTKAEEGERIVIAVADRGPGVPDASLPRIFDPFYRAEASRSRATGGLGLGLMLVARIVAAHGGSVDAMNRPGGGLLVRVVLPVG